MKEYFEYEDDKSSKFWEIEQDGTSVTTRYGKIGSDGTSSTKEYESEEKAEFEAQKLIKSKLAKGYESAESDEDSVSSLFYAEYHGPMTRAVSLAVKEAILALQKLKETQNLGFLEVDVDMDYSNGNIKFWYEYKDGTRSYFYSHHVGELMIETYKLMDRMDEEGGTPYPQALSNFFEDAGLSRIDKKLLEGLNFSLNVADVGGSPYLEHFTKKD